MCSLHPLMLRSCADIRAAWREFPLTNRLGVRYEPAIDQPDEHTADRCRRPAHEHDARSGMKPPGARPIRRADSGRRSASKNDSTLSA